MKVSVPDLIITSFETLTAYTMAGDYWFTLDELQSFTLGQTQDSTDITGKQGRKLSTLKRNKAVTISGNSGLVSGGLLEVQTGSNFVNGKTDILWTDYLTVTGNSATTSYKAVGTAGAEITDVFIRNADGTRGDELTQAAAAESGKFTYSPETKALTFSDLQDGTEVLVHYHRSVNAPHMENSGDTTSGKAVIFADALAEDKCANIYRVQIYIPKADFKGEFSLEMGENQVVHAFEADSLAGVCGNSGNLWNYTIIGANAEDA